MALTRRRSNTKRYEQRPKQGRNHRSVQLSSYQFGCIAGFQRGKEDGFAQGRTAAGNVQYMDAKGAVAIAPQPRQLDVLVITAGMIASLEIGITQPFNALQKSGNFNYELKTEDNVSRDDIATAHTILFLRNVEPSAYRYLEWAHELGKRTVYVIDDNFLEIPTTTPVGQYYADPDRRETFVKFLRNANIVKVDSPRLGDYIQERCKRKVVYFPGSVDFDWLDDQPKRDAVIGPIVIGYEGGSKEEDFEVVVPALKKIINYYGGFVRLEFLGFLPHALSDHPSVKFEECAMDYRSFIRKLSDSQWDIGLAPLQDHSFNNTKTNNKFREYGACRIAGVYSNSPAYQPWVTQGETGYLVPHTEDGWYEGLVAMIENPAMRSQIKDNAEIAARQNFSLTQCLDNWNTLIFNA